MSLQRIPLLLSVALIAVAGIVVTHLPAQTTSSGGTVTDAPPTISLTVQSADSKVPGYRPGIQILFTFTVTDNAPLQSVIATMSPIVHMSSTIDFYQCNGKTSCEDKAYIIPSAPGPQFVTITAKDSVGQVSTKTVDFSAPACISDADCGGDGSTQWNPASAQTCDSPSGGVPTDIVQGGTSTTCRSSGICETTEKRLVKQTCTSGQVCAMKNSTTAACIAQPPVCPSDGPIIAACVCGLSIEGVSSLWAFDESAGRHAYCCNSQWGYARYSVPCSQLQSVSSPASPQSACGSTLSSSSQPTSTVPGTFSSVSPSVQTPSVTAPSAIPITPLSPTALPVRSGATLPQQVPTPITHPAPSLMPPRAQTGSTAVQKMVSKANLKALRKQQQALRKKLRSLERSLLRKKNVTALSQIADLRDELADLDLRDPSIADNLRSLQEEIADLRQIVSKKTKRGG